MPYDPRDEVTYDYIDDRDRDPGSDYWRDRDPPRRPMEPQGSGPSSAELQRIAQMAAYLATNPDPQTGLPRVQDTRDGMTQAQWYANKAKMDVINNPAVIMSTQEKAAINNSKKRMDARGNIVSNTRVLYPPLKTKRTRKKTKMDRTMSKCLKMSNARYRNKNGKLKKGKTMSDVMKLAHRLCRKHG